MNNKPRVLIAGIGGASLGTEVLKCLLLADRYILFGCDISPLAFGHYSDGFEETFLIDRNIYIKSVMEVCRRARIEYIVPGGEEPLALLAEAVERLASEGIRLAANSKSVFANFSDKRKCFEVLASLGFQVPLTITVEKARDLNAMTYPCIVKPAVGTGGSSFVFLASNKDEASLYIKYLFQNGKTAILQEYLPEKEGEFTVGVLSLPNKQVVGSVALKRLFDFKLSVLAKGNAGVLSSGYSQGLIEDFPAVRAAAEKIAVAIKSEGPVNIQGRVRNGVLVPFEVNPRFSASTYLRALAGFNEIDIYLQYLSTGIFNPPRAIRPGYYLRTLSEVFVSKDNLKK